ncbi:MAG: TRL-like family protein [Treponema sp.]|jgi:hypothetical protein|nr:TRL-like family protein [Treponema sp.]
MKKLFIFMIVIMAVAFMGCTSITYYVPQAVTDNPVGPKVGEASTKLGPTAIQEAARNAGITRIATVDIRVTQSFMSIEQVYVVSGE